MKRVIALVVVTCGIAFGQKDTASIAGTVLDPSGASVPGAEVSTTNIDTNFANKATSDTARQYVISPVRIGRYRVSVAAQGFKTAVAPLLTLDVQQRARLGFNLVPGTL